MTEKKQLKNLRGLITPPPVSRSTFSKRSLHGQTASMLGRNIINGTIPTGSVLPLEAELTKDLGVSRSVLREAMLVLTAKGLLESRQRLGTTVRAREHWNLLDPDVLDWLIEAADPNTILNLFEIRLVIEPAAAAIAAERATPSKIKSIEAAMLEMEKNVDCLQDFVQPDLDFHQEILKASGNEFLDALASLVQDAVLTVMVVTQISEEKRKQRLILHRKVFEAIKKKSASEASEAMRVLVMEAQNDLLEALNAVAPV